MSKPIVDVIHANGAEISVITAPNEDDFISLTDIARYRNKASPADVVKNWMRVRSTIEYLGLWESIHNPAFKLVEFDVFRNEAGSNAFTLSPQQWIRSTNAIGIRSKSGRYGGGTFAHKDIAFEFASWISPEFKLYIIQDYQRLKESDTHRDALNWSVKRLIAAANYRIHTDAIKEHLIPPDLSKRKESLVYASEADMLNVALFGVTAKQWRAAHPETKGNLRDEATIEQLLVLSNLETANALLISRGLEIQERALLLNQMAISQMRSLVGLKSVEELKHMDASAPKQLSDENN
ncbi:MAG: KilA-N domain-containing protein [Clostridia bacterium]|nr:KilA-N domain-containing protein [Clostridia bacterium]